ncbi:small VCP/p97-interacting protein [Scyliorhinus canicula]|uniref:small VCP/p97-interacting protein n=1 Tax=Scyliorhinus canicula TaxID=7830 RepID=UPI0018F69EA8|nr:small VCP/p97-interacting protein [Scyliorhinus canicula]
MPEPFSAAVMGLCLPCLGGATEEVVETPDPDTRRRQLAEAAEKRQKENVHRGVKNPESVERKKKKLEALEKQEMNSASAGGGGLRWQVG